MPRVALHSFGRFILAIGSLSETIQRIASAACVSGILISGENSISRNDGLDFQSSSGSLLTSYASTSSDRVMDWRENIVPPYRSSKVGATRAMWSSSLPSVCRP